MDEFLRQAISSPTGCPLCRAAEIDEYYLLISLTTALGKGGGDRMVEMGPPCNFHGTRFSKVAAGKATASLCQHFLLRRVPADLAEDGGPVRCPICLMLAARQRQWLDVFDAAMRDEHARRLYAAGDGLCVPHYRAAQAQAGSARDFLDQCASPQRERLLAGLDRFIRQGHFHTEPGVWGVWKRAREKLFGCPGLTLYLSRCAAEAP
ncbi:MAG: hypothetical protein ACPMAQ_13600 [Phycisphaerae bacterium]